MRKICPNYYDWIYVVGHPDGMYKIGKTSNLKRRFYQIEFVSPYRLDPTYACKPDHRDGALERVIHIALRKYHLRAEWFDCDLDTIIGAIHDHAGLLKIKIDEEVRPFEIEERNDQRIKFMKREALGYAPEMHALYGDAVP